MAETGFPHVFTEDCEFEGYHFEKGTVVTWNSWHITSNPEEYEDPLEFKPERYLDEHLWDTLYGHWGFGAGTAFSAVAHSRETSMCWVERCTSKHVYCIRESAVLFRLL